MSDKTLATTYLKGEGRAHLAGCMEATFAHCRDHDVNTLVIYTATGEGPVMAVERFLSQPQFASMRIVAVTPPANRTYVEDPRHNEPSFVQTGIFGDRRKRLDDAGVPIVSARLPFHSMLVGSQHKEPMQLVDLAFGVLGGGFSLCIQATMMACDAGAITNLERVAAMSADTALVLISSHSESFFSPKTGMLVEHIICRPLLYDISKRTHFVTEYELEQNNAIDEGTQLPLPGLPAPELDAELDAVESAESMNADESAESKGADFDLGASDDDPR